VPDSLHDPDATFEVNAGGTLHLLNAARAVAADGLRPRVLVVGSSDVYGAQPPAAYPLKETAPLLPRNPYAASKAAADALAQAYARSYGVDAVVTRAFNHIGPHQDERFAVAAFAAQIARVAAGLDRVVLVGNLDASRDVLDVRDVCDAYALLLEGLQRLQRRRHHDARTVAAPHRDRTCSGRGARRPSANAAVGHPGQRRRRLEGARGNRLDAADSLGGRAAGRLRGRPCADRFPPPLGLAPTTRRG
jgi:nucleoside-diphosphate-sugar epimerase